MGKAIAAYVRLILPGPSKFDRYVAAVLMEVIGFYGRVKSAPNLSPRKSRAS